MTQGSTKFGEFPNTDIGGSRQWSGVDMPKGWRRLGIKPEEHNYTLKKQTFKQSKSNLYNGSVLLGSAYAMTPSQMPFLPSGGVPANTRLEAWSRLATKIRGHDFDASIFMSESVLSVQLIVDTIRSLAAACRYCRLGQWGPMVRSLARSYSGPKKDREKWQRAMNKGDLAAALLAVRYGWTPMLNDVLEACKAFDALMGGKSLTFRASYKTGGSTKYGCTNSNGVVTAEDVFRCHLKATLKEKVSMTRSLGLLNPIPTIYERIPFSFVLDWFIPVGTYLQEWAFFNGLEARYTETLVVERNSRVSKRPTYSDSTWPRSNGVVGGDFKSSSISLSRSIGTESPSLGVELKTASQAFSRVHIENAAALVVAITSGRAREYYLGRGR